MKQQIIRHLVRGGVLAILTTCSSSIYLGCVGTILPTPKTIGIVR